MQFLPAITKCFRSRDWTMGYWLSSKSQQRVEILFCDENELKARILGAIEFLVQLNWEDCQFDSYVFVNCTCPHYAEGINCSHLAAVVQTAAREGLLPELNVRKLEFIDGDGSDFDEVEYSRNRTSRSIKQRPQIVQPPAIWLGELRLMANRAREEQFALRHSGLGNELDRAELFYVIETDRRHDSDDLRIRLAKAKRLKSGDLGVPSFFSLPASTLRQLPAADREICDDLFGSRGSVGDDEYGYDFDDMHFGSVQLSPSRAAAVLPKIAASGRLFFGSDPRALAAAQPLQWDDGEPWRLAISFEREDEKKQWKVSGQLQRADQHANLSDAVALFKAGFVVLSDRISRLMVDESFVFAEALRKSREWHIADKQKDQFLEQLYQVPQASGLALPAELRWETIAPPLQKQAIIQRGKHGISTQLSLQANNQYDDVVADRDHATMIMQREQRRIIRRDPAGEMQAQADLASLSLKEDYYTREFVLPAKRLSEVVAALTSAGWRVQADGKLYRQAGEFKLDVKSTVDWFDLQLCADFEGINVGWPELLAAIKKGDKMVTLDDGSQGMLPENWLAKFSSFADLGEIHDDALRFKPSQGAILDAMLAAQEHVTVDAGFERLRGKLASFAGIKPSEPTRYFTGTLRDYQREGLGWLHFLREFGVGGCLADDMGLGKTVQVLALLEARRARRISGEQSRKPSLVVVPKSLVFNWLEEAKRFAPKLKMFNFTGLDRKQIQGRFSDFDLIVTTYGTLRRDILPLSEVDFDYAILDEAQAIKNAAAQTAKASRLLKADHRLAMTGTPVENHLGELWSLFEFLNPGMLGRSGQLHKLLSAGKSTEEQYASAQILGKALRPFMLRRTKEKVLTELPAKTEQTLFCELEGEQRKLYDELRDHYRASLTNKIKTQGLNRSKIHVLEALLRLRQAACHPQLIDKKNTSCGSAKLEMLLEQVQEVTGERHKTLIFSQFTSLLAIVRRELDKAGIVYEYLDGKTNNRQQRVERFQTDPNCPVFLISLKAGGHGLNLTAADYVFILDPWWNPAVEAQAVDRAHRIGQQQPVFAYRLIAKDTIEEKILELQAGKKQLAEAIVAEDNSLLGGLSAEDLEFLLS